MSEFRDFDELQVYQIALDLADWTYDLVRNFPQDEKFGLISQIKRASTSIPANIAEGYGRFHYKENRLFCFYARGSLSELKSHLIFCGKRGFITRDQYKQFLEKYKNLQVKLNNYIKSIGRQNTTH